MLKIENLSKSYAKSEVKAVDGLSLELKPGEIFGFLGPNGAGKTTTIKILTGILQYEEGSVSVCGYDLKTQSNDAKRNIGYVSDSHVIYDKLTGREYVDFMADVYGVDIATRKERADRLLEKFELTDAFDSQIKTYSHGMKQKISIIGALIHNPNLWVLDEPMTGLDPQSAFQLKELMRAHCAEGKTVFFSTHVLEVAEKICDRIGIIVKGKLIIAGNLEEIKAAQGDSSLEDIFLSVAGGRHE
ncbi:ABC transporter ATP-binding protein [Pumilibacter muris]|uniref:ABC transporter ATP-binding protein n=1 Tax=Pumilibacter muris TaxID=2941510 RepID=UPI00203A6B12|nr:ABC transporter ATP-binding protein [Pumilibacter muris]